MYAIIQIGPSQYKVSEGDTIEINPIASEEGKSLTFSEVLLYVDGSDVRIGQPFLKDMKVTARVLKHSLGDKLVAFHYRKRKSSSKKTGHRQKLTTLNITRIETK